MTARTPGPSVPKRAAVPRRSAVPVTAIAASRVATARRVAMTRRVARPSVRPTRSAATFVGTAPAPARPTRAAKFAGVPGVKVRAVARRMTTATTSMSAPSIRAISTPASASTRRSTATTAMNARTTSARTVARTRKTPFAATTVAPATVTSTATGRSIHSTRGPFWPGSAWSRAGMTTASTTSTATGRSIRWTAAMYWLDSASAIRFPSATSRCYARSLSTTAKMPRSPR